MRNWPVIGNAARGYWSMTVMMMKINGMIKINEMITNGLNLLQRDLKIMQNYMRNSMMMSFQ